MLNARMQELLAEIQLENIKTETERYAENIEKAFYTVMNKLILMT